MAFEIMVSVVLVNFCQGYSQKKKTDLIIKWPKNFWYVVKPTNQPTDQSITYIQESFNK